MLEIIHKLLDEPSFKAQVKVTSKQYKTDEIILEQGKPQASFYIIKKGKVRVFVRTELKDHQQTRRELADLGPTNTFAEFSIFDDLPASADVMALQETDLLEIDIQSFRLYLANNPQLGYQVFRAMLNDLVGRLRHADKSIVSLHTWGNKEEKPGS